MILQESGVEDQVNRVSILDSILDPRENQVETVSLLLHSTVTVSQSLPSLNILTIPSGNGNIDLFKRDRNKIYRHDCDMEIYINSFFFPWLSDCVQSGVQCTRPTLMNYLRNFVS